MSKKIAAIVVTYNRKELLAECLHALLKQSRHPDKIIVIDNASRDGTQNEMLLRGFLSNSKIDYVRFEENIGGSGGFYEGIKRAHSRGYDYFWIMDDDAIADQDALKQLVNGYTVAPNAGFVCSSVIGVNNCPMNTPVIDNRLGVNSYPVWNQFLRDGMVKVRAATFVSVLIARSTVDAVGLPIRNMFIWGDDTDYTIRITNHMGAYLVGSSVVIHKRAIAKPPNILLENNIDRIKNFFYFYRNETYIAMAHRSKKRAILFFADSFTTSIKSLTAKSHKITRFITIIRGLIAGIFFKPYNH